MAKAPASTRSRTSPASWRRRPCPPVPQSFLRKGVLSIGIGPFNRVTTIANTNSNYRHQQL